MISQNAKILAHLKTGAPITPVGALKLYGCFRLSARIKDLREAGHNIVTDRAEGEKKFAIYSLVRDDTTNLPD